MSSNMRSVATLAAGVSLFGVTGYLLYLLLKRDDDENSDYPFVTNLENYKLEVKIPKEHVRSIIGRNGSNIKDIERKSQTKVNFKDQDKSENFRICIIRGTSSSCAVAEALIHEFIANQPVIEVKDIMVPRSAVGRVIGRCGERIHNITTLSGAKIFVAPETESPESSERRINIKGSAEQIEVAVSCIMDIVKEDAEARQRLEDKLSKREPRGKPKMNNIEKVDSSFKKSWEKLTNSSTDGHMEVYVSAAVNPSQFWLQIVGPNANELDQLVEEMTDYYSKPENRQLHALTDISVGEIVAAVFSFDEKWYRAEVVNIKDINDKKMAQLYYVDYGDSDEIPTNEIFELRTDFLRLRFQAIECYLSKIKPKEVEWTYEACDKFDELTHLAQWKKLKARVNGYRERDTSPYGRLKREGSPIPGVDLYDVNNENDIDIGAELVKNGFAIYEESLNGSPNHSTRLSSSSLSLTNGNDNVGIGESSNDVGTLDNSKGLTTTLDSLSDIQTNSGSSKQPSTNTPATSNDVQKQSRHQ